ncbi:hypothetical protein [Neobacillus terrae]|uniref:hypothetical protein n=1 Tax=Neobacillus terrae TaxID=3034837 RepID=UPI001408827E|nr:hypothetical protein [Neobacillus terrae]NHM29406.1 hypothetical protein [Neobacillus terrae]
MLIHAMAIETIGLHYFLHQWNPIASSILLIFNIYGILFFLAEIQAIRLSPFLVTEDELILQAGLSKGMQIPLREIEEFKTYSGPDIIPGKKKNNIFDARPSDFIMEKPQFQIKLKNKLRIFYMYGLRGSVNQIILSVDNPGEFSSYLKDKLNRLTDSK